MIGLDSLPTLTKKKKAVTAAKTQYNENNVSDSRALVKIRTVFTNKQAEQKRVETLEN